MAIWRMRISCWILKATSTQKVCVILIAFQLQQLASLLSYKYVECFVVTRLSELI